MLLETQKEAIKYYDNVSSIYRTDCSSYSTKQQLSLIEKYTKKSSIVAEIGCATGLFTIETSKMCRHIDGFDTSKKMIENANKNKTHRKNIDFILKNKSLSDYKKNYDLVFSFATLLWVQRPGDLIIQMLHVLKNPGILVLDISNKYNLSSRFWNKCYTKRDHPVLTPWTYYEVCNFLKNNNLNILEIHALGFLDQWKYLPVISRVASKLSFIDKLIHHPKFDLDYFISNLRLFKPLANRWYIVCQKK